ncbi:MAG: chemotaxis protein CheR [Thermoleophilia bacterium]|nr:chemotaxis protein CheR [Thermoleophilia bacterium]
MALTYDQFLKAAGQLLELDWRKYRRRSARRHLRERLNELGIEDYEGYLQRLRSDAGEAQRLPDLMRVTVSRFFRERDQWLELAGILPEFINKRNEGAPLMAWSAGSCNGEEAYSLAILYLDLLGHPPNDDAAIDILGTDIDKEVLARARSGCYEEGALREVPGELRTRYFHRTGQRFCVNEPVRRLVRFERHNLMEDPLPKEMDLVLCRYLAFTYYRGRRRRRAAERLWQAMRPGAILMIGRKDSLGPQDDLFERWPESTVLFRRRNRSEEHSGRG